MSIRNTIIRKIWGKNLYHPFLITNPNTATTFGVESCFSTRVEKIIGKNIKSVPMYDRNYKKVLKHPDNYIDLRVVTVLRTTKNRVLCHRGLIYCPAQAVTHTDTLNLFDTYLLGGKAFMQSLFKEDKIADFIKSTTPTFRGGMITYDKNWHKVAYLLNVIVVSDEIVERVCSDYLKPEYCTGKWEFRDIKESNYLTDLQEAVRVELPYINETTDEEDINE